MEELKLFLGITGDGEDALLALLLREAEAYICTYCNLEALPPELETAAARLAAAMYRAGEGGSDGSVTALTEGDVTVHYTAEEAIPDGIRSMLDSYRRIRW